MDFVLSERVLRGVETPATMSAAGVSATRLTRLTPENRAILVPENQWRLHPSCRLALEPTDTI